MDTTKLSNNGRVVIPQRIREQYGWEAGTEFIVEGIEGGIALQPVKKIKPTTIDEVYGCLPYQGPRKSLADMEEGIRKGAR
ncbi:MAG: AbrB/MazE/SpoVT family DNA-binding domain-containing protein [Candidatus Latescibacteria bacterium]|nr:AbrB/MazE/SpoVT family DNA-binding domain-containing protein [Candidatus Latescibacterota bacterium]